MGYSGTARTQYRQSGGQAIDNTAARTAFDPTPARVALFTDIDRQQWGMVTDWAHPSHYTEIEAGDGGYTGTSGSYAVATLSIVYNLVVPPRVTLCDMGAVISGALNVKVTNALDTVGVQLAGAFMAGTSGHDDPDSAGIVWGTGASSQSPLPLSARSMVVASSSGVAQTTIVPLTIAIKRTDLTLTSTGSGGVLWGIVFRWARTPLEPFKPGTDTADSLSV